MLPVLLLLLLLLLQLLTTMLIEIYVDALNVRADRKEEGWRAVFESQQLTMVPVPRPELSTASW